MRKSLRKSQVLGAGVEPAYLSVPEPKSGVSAIPPPERLVALASPAIRWLASGFRKTMQLVGPKENRL